METSFAEDQAARFARIKETRALADQITELAGRINAANYRFLSLIAEFDRRSDGARGDQLLEGARDHARRLPCH